MRRLTVAFAVLLCLLSGCAPKTPAPLEKSFSATADIVYKGREYAAVTAFNAENMLALEFTYPDEARSTAYFYDGERFEIKQGELCAQYEQNPLPDGSAFSRLLELSRLLNRQEGGFELASSDGDTAIYRCGSAEISADFNTGRILSFKSGELEAEFRRSDG